jgi:hypothetical protein
MFSWAFWIFQSKYVAVDAAAAAKVREAIVIVIAQEGTTLPCEANTIVVDLMRTASDGDDAR